MIGLVVSNLRRRPARALLTALGTAVGVATIVALLGVVGGIERSAGQFVHLGRADFGIFQRDASDPTASALPQSLVKRVRAQPGVALATPLTLLIEAIPSQPSVVVFGAKPDGFVARRLVFVNGSAATTDRAVAVGDTLAGTMHLHVGSTLRIHNDAFHVSGIYHAGISFQDNGAVITLPTAQRLDGTPNEVTTIPVQVDPGSKPKGVRAQLLRRFPGTQIIGSSEEAARAGANGVLISHAAFVIAVIALIAGGIAVATATLMSVLERRSEFALLSAVGWSSGQITLLVLGEGVAVSLLGAGIGLLLGVVGADLLVSALGASAFVSPELTAWGFGRGILVGVALGVFGGLYPAWRVARMPPAPSLARR